MKEIDIKKAFELADPVFIDVRSPVEFKESHIPEAINLPLFSDEERAQVGTTYKQEGPKPAKWLGMQLVSPKIPSMMECIRSEKEKGKNVVIYCSRGGMRSKSVATFADMAGIEVHRLTGGLRHYRQWVLENLNASLLPKTFIVLHGMTGVGKTAILDRLKNKGFPVLDLEKCAGHRGSVFGGIGMEVHNQKTFESLLYHELRKIQDLPYAFMEAESRRIGKAVQPDFLLEAKKKGSHVILETSVEIRINRIYEEYVQPYLNQDRFKDRVVEAITPILKRFVPATREQLLTSIEQGDYHHLIHILLTEYYDPRYRHKLEEYQGPFHNVQANDLDQATAELIQIASEMEKIELIFPR